MYPVFFGSAVTGAGVPLLMASLTELLPAAAGDAAGPVVCEPMIRVILEVPAEAAGSVHGPPGRAESSRGSYPPVRSPSGR